MISRAAQGGPLLYLHIRRPGQWQTAKRYALREAETAIIDAAKLIDPAAPGDKQPAEDLEAAGFVVRKWRKVLEAGDWPGREVDPYPAPGERVLDGTTK